MTRLAYIEIGGKDYPMLYSLAAEKVVAQKHGSLEKFFTSLEKGEEHEIVSEIIWVLELLMRQGCAYKNFFEANVPIPENAPVIDGKYVSPSAEMIEVGIAFCNLTDIKDKIIEAIVGAKKPSIKTEEVGEKTKNVATT